MKKNLLKKDKLFKFDLFSSISSFFSNFWYLISIVSFINFSIFYMKI